jgi:hypothetical protein
MQEIDNETDRFDEPDKFRQSIRPDGVNMKNRKSRLTVEDVFEKRTGPDHIKILFMSLFIFNTFFL